MFVLRVGLWVLSGHGCAGICGPRYRWEEEDAEKSVAATGETFAEGDVLPWTWRECTLLRVIDAYEFCLTNKLPRGSWAEKKAGTQSRAGTAPFEGMDKVFAAIGLAPGERPARRGVLSEDLFESPQAEESAEQLREVARQAPSVDLPAPAVQSREKEIAGPSAPMMKLPYPFTGHDAQISSEDVVPFPPSPEPDADDQHSQSEAEEEGDMEEEGEDPTSGEADESGMTSDDRRTSGSMSSLGRPITSRYPFQFRGPRGRGGSISSSSHMSPTQVTTPQSRQSMSTPSRSTQSRSANSRSTKSTGNRESSDSPMSYGGSSNAPSPPPGLVGSVMPMPPRHPQTRSRARTVPAPSPGSQSSASPVAFPGQWSSSRARMDSARTRTESDMSMTFGPVPVPFVLDSEDEEGQGDSESLMDVPEAEVSGDEAAEQRDSVGLLYAGTSPRASRTSLRQFTSGLQRRANGSRSHSGTTSRSASRSRTTSTNSHSESARSRAQSLIQSIGAASRSSLELVTRSRANSMARLSDSPYYSTSPDPLPSSPENNTFGFIRRPHPRVETTGHAAEHDDDHSVSDVPALPSPASVHGSRASSTNVSVMGEETTTAPRAPRRRHTSEVSHVAPSERTELSVRTERGAPHSPQAPSSSQSPQSPSAPVQIPGREVHAEASMPDLSTAPASFVTAPATVQGTTDSSGRTPSSWGTARLNYPPGQGRTWEPA